MLNTSSHCGIRSGTQEKKGTASTLNILATLWKQIHTLLTALVVDSFRHLCLKIHYTSGNPYCSVVSGYECTEVSIGIDFTRSY